MLPMVILEAPSDVGGVVSAAITGLGPQITPIIGVAIGVSLIPFAAKWIFRKAKSLVS